MLVDPSISSALMPRGGGMQDIDVSNSGEQNIKHQG